MSTGDPDGVPGSQDVGHNENRLRAELFEVQGSELFFQNTPPATLTVSDPSGGFVFTNALPPHTLGSFFEVQCRCLALFFQIVNSPGWLHCAKTPFRPLPSRKKRLFFAF
jgi:hypothetical protein